MNVRTAEIARQSDPRQPLAEGFRERRAIGRQGSVGDNRLERPPQTFPREACRKKSGTNRLRMIGLAVLVAGTSPPPTRAQSTLPRPVEDRTRAVECLTLAIAYEAGFESAEGQQAVGEVVLNRARHPAFPKSVCGVVFAGSTLKTGCQFTFTCDGSMRRILPERVMAQSRKIAGEVIDGRLPPLVGDALNYHADYVSPYWAPSLERVTKIGAHIFYRRRGTAIAVLAGRPVSGFAPNADQAAVPAPVTAPAPAFAPWGLAPPVPAPIFQPVGS